MRTEALLVSSANTLPPSLKELSQTVLIILIFGELILLINSSVLSSESPTATTTIVTGKQIGRAHV